MFAVSPPIIWKGYCAAELCCAEVTKSGERAETEMTTGRGQKTGCRVTQQPSEMEKNSSNHGRCITVTYILMFAKH